MYYLIKLIKDRLFHQCITLFKEKISRKIKILRQKTQIVKHSLVIRKHIYGVGEFLISLGTYSSYTPNSNVNNGDAIRDKKN